LRPRGGEKGDDVVFRHLVGVGQPVALLAEPSKEAPSVAKRLEGRRLQVAHLGETTLAASTSSVGETG